MTAKLPDVQTLVELNKTHTRNDIARMYGVTPQAVSDRLIRAGYRVRNERRHQGRQTRRDILNAIVEFKRMHGGCSPTRRQLAATVGRAYSVVAHHLNLMERDKWIRRLPTGQIVVVGSRWIPPDWIAQMEDSDAV